VRLDHLLSKESTPLGSRTFVRVESGHPVDALAGSRTSRSPRALELRELVLSSVVKVRPGPFGGLQRVSLQPDERVSSAVLENFIASTSIFVCKSQVIKGQRWMPWRQEPMKDVGGCDKPRVGAYQPLIRGCPNGATPHPSWGVTPA
jgi:hypothetical protein